MSDTGGRSAIAALARAGRCLPLAISLGLAAGCAATSGPLRVVPESLLPEAFSRLDRIGPDEARAVRDQVPTVRESARDALVRERIACYRRFLTNACIADVDRRERLVDARLDRIEIAAQQAIREAAAVDLNRRAAEAIRDREAREAAEASARAGNRRTYETRLEAAEAERAQRDAERPELERRAAANRAERERREARNAVRREEAARRAEQDAGNAAARRQALEQRRVDGEARDEREAARRTARQADRPRTEMRSPGGTTPPTGSGARPAVQ